MPRSPNVARIGSPYLVANSWSRSSWAGLPKIAQWDSLMQLRLIGEIEDEYDVEIPLDEVPEINTLADGNVHQTHKV